jgi:hypothetical protein
MEKHMKFDLNACPRNGRFALKGMEDGRWKFENPQILMFQIGTSRWGMPKFRFRTPSYNPFGYEGSLKQGFCQTQP